MWIEIWDYKTGTNVHTFPETIDGAFFEVSPDGKWLVINADSHITIWDLHQQEEISSFLTARGGPLTFSPDNRRLFVGVSGSNSQQANSSIEVWDISDILSPRKTIAMEVPRTIFYMPYYDAMSRRLINISSEGWLMQWEAFPWTKAEFPSGENFQASIQDWASDYWSQRYDKESKSNPDEKEQTVWRTYRRSEWPVRDSDTPNNLIDLIPYYTGFLDSISFFGYYEYEAENTLSALEPGIRQMGEVSFDVRGIIQLRCRDDRNKIGAQAWEEHFPLEVNGIPVGRTFEKIHFLGGVYVIPGHLANGRHLGSYVLNYTDGSTCELELKYNENIRNWNGKPGDGEEDLIVWRGQNRFTEWNDLEIQLSKTTFKNPFPKKEVESISLVSTMTRAGPFVLGITVE